ncbi:MAG: hypothetical protein AAF483_20615 [Planctomycetota bacterium]
MSSGLPAYQSSSIDTPPGYTLGSNSFTLHPIRGIVWACFWGTILGAGVVMAINYFRVGRSTAALATLACFLAATFALFGLFLVIPEDLPIPNAVYIVVQIAACFGVAKALQGEMIEEHAMRGGNVCSGWPGAGIGFLCLPIFVIGFVCAYFVFDSSLGTRMDYGNDEVYYSEGATEEDADELAFVLNQQGFFGGAGVSARIRVEDGTYYVSFVLMDGAWDDPELVLGFEELGAAIKARFQTPLVIELCDAFFTSQKEIYIE